MEMRAKEDIQQATDITPPLPPLAFSLFNSLLSSHFLPLSSPTTTTTSTTFLGFCTTCATTSTTVSLHFSSAEHHLFTLLHSSPSLFPFPDTSDLRLSLRLLLLLNSPPSPPPPRLLGLLTNQHRFGTDDEEFSRVRTGARVMAMARAKRGKREFVDGDGDGFEVEEAVLCLVITNAVEIVINGQRLGIAVYDKCFSWINHSCSPNSCFRFVPAMVSEESDCCSSSSKMRIAPCGGEDGSGCSTCDSLKGVGNYGPRVVVRSIKGVRRGEEVTIAYTDLLQPTALRQSELLLEYKFICICKRCSAVPQTYVDHALQETFVDLHISCSKSPIYRHIKERAVEKKDMLDSIIAEYMEVGDPVSCCEKVEGLLSEGLFYEPLEQTKGASHADVRLSPLHYLCLNAYTTLISTYKIRAGLRITEMHVQSIDMSRTSAAYSLLRAGVTHHLFLSEPSLIASAATFCIDAGEALLNFGRSPSWDSFANGDLQNLSVVYDADCPRCSLIDKFKSTRSSSRTQNKFSDDISQEFIQCVSDITPKVWRFLIQGCNYLKDVKDPIDFSWIQSLRTSDNAQSQHDAFLLCNEIENGDLVRSVTGNESIDVMTDILPLSTHCLLYGGYLSSICYGHSCSTKLIRNLIHI